MTLYSTMLCGTGFDYLDQPDAFRAIVEFYVDVDDRILDLTYSKGVFWKRVGDLYSVVRSDRYPQPLLDLRADYKALPFRPESFDAVVFDPPYGNSSTTKRTDAIERQYNLDSVKGEKAIRLAYWGGIIESCKVLRTGGLLIVKCQNFVSSGKQHWIEYDILWMAKTLEMEAIDKFLVISPARKPIMRHENQVHARKWGSIFWIFQKK